jgi:hypothetical protein
MRYRNFLLLISYSSRSSLSETQSKHSTPISLPSPLLSRSLDSTSSGASQRANERGGKGCGGLEVIGMVPCFYFNCLELIVLSRLLNFFPLLTLTHLAYIAHPVRCDPLGGVRPLSLHSPPPRVPPSNRNSSSRFKTTDE